MLTSIDIESALRGVDHFLGVYAINQIPNNKHRPLYFIVNNQSNNLPGQHWIGVMISNKNNAYIFDPLGFPPPQQLIKQLRKQYGIFDISYSKTQYQNAGATDCGNHVVNFVLNPSEYYK